MKCQQQDAVSLWELFIPRGCSLPCDPTDLAGDTGYIMASERDDGAVIKPISAPLMGCSSLVSLQLRLFGTFGDAQAFNIIDFLHQWCCCCHPSSRKPIPAEVHPACSTLCL